MSLRTPPLDATDEELEAFRSAWFNYENPVRNRILEDCCRNLLYEAGRQWIVLDTALIGRTGNGYTFKDIQDDCPKPVTNFIADAIEAELGSFAARKLTPIVIPSSNDPKIKAAAKEGESILNYKLDRMQWGLIRNEFDHHRCLFSMGLLWLRWDQNYFDTTLVHNSQALKCSKEGCTTTLSSPMLPDAESLAEDQQEPLHADLGEVDKEGNTRLAFCPTCEEPTPLMPFEHSLEEASSRDFFGRTIGEAVPRGEPMIEVPSRFDYFPENSGVGLTPRTIRAHGFASVRPVPWAEERYPELGEIEPESPQELLRWHPAVNSWDLMGNLLHSDAEVYSDHIRVYTHITLPCMTHPKGWVLEFVGTKIAAKYPLMKEGAAEEGGEPAEAPLHVVGIARYKDIPTRLDGKSLVDDAISLQNRINVIDSQYVETRLKFKTGILAPGNVSMDQPEWGSKQGVTVLRTEPSPLAPGAVPTIFQTKLFPTEAFTERTQCISDLRTIVGPKGVETGEPPKNVSTTSGLQLLGEQIDKRRGPREEERLLAFKNIWEGLLTQLSVLRNSLDQDCYELEDNGVWTKKQFDSTTLMGQTKIKIEAQAEVSKSLIQRESMREAQADQLIDVSTPVARKRVLELRGLPTNVNDEVNHQVDCAERTWSDYKEQRKLPVIDYSLDNPAIRFEVLQGYLLSEDGMMIQEQAGWQKALPSIAGWEEELLKLEQADALARQTYPDTSKPAADEQYAKLAEIYVGQKKQYEQALAADAQAKQMGVPTSPLPPPPVQPPPPQFAPRDLSQRVLGVWNNMLQQAGVAADPQFLAFMSVVYAYKKLAQQQAMAAQAPPGGPAGAPPAPTMPQPNPSAPGAA